MTDADRERFTHVIEMMSETYKIAVFDAASDLAVRAFGLDVYLAQMGLTKLPLNEGE